MNPTDLLRRIDRAIFDHDRYPRLLDAAIGDCETLLDVGCGSQSPIWLAALRLAHVVGLDGFAPSIEHSRAAGIHHEYVMGDIRDLSRFRAGQFDAVTCLDVIEHLPKEEGYALLRDLERIARRQVIVSTPQGFVPQDGSYDANRLQEHLSGWRIWDFEDRGYRVVGFGGWRPLKGAYGLPRWWPRLLWWRVAMITERLLRGAAGPSYHLLAIKAAG